MEQQNHSYSKKDPNTMSMQLNFIFSLLHLKLLKLQASWLEAKESK